MARDTEAGRLLSLDVLSPQTTTTRLALLGTNNAPTVDLGRTNRLFLTVEKCRIESLPGTSTEAFQEHNR
jgi:hypothetical protein